MRRIGKVAVLEWEELLCKKSLWLWMACYTALVAAICRFPYLRQSYFSMIESVPVMLLNFITPVFLAIILVVTLSPVFAGDREKNVEAISAACLVGKQGRGIAKLLAALLFSVCVCLMLVMAALLVPLCCGLFDGGCAIASVGGAVNLVPVWTAGQHVLFACCCLLAACVIGTPLLLFLSRVAHTALAAGSLGALLLLFEYLFHRFSFPALLREYNLCVFFEPYYFFELRFWNGSPYGNLLALFAAFLPLCLFAAGQIARK